MSRTYSQTHGIDMVHFTRQKNNSLCQRDAFLKATRGGLYGLIIGLFSVIVATKHRGVVVKSITKSMGLSMSLGVGVFICLERSVEQCRLQLNNESVAEYWMERHNQDDVTIIK